MASNLNKCVERPEGQKNKLLTKKGCLVSAAVAGGAVSLAVMVLKSLIEQVCDDCF